MSGSLLFLILSSSGCTAALALWLLLRRTERRRRQATQKPPESENRSAVWRPTIVALPASSADETSAGSLARAAPILEAASATQKNLAKNEPVHAKNLGDAESLLAPEPTSACGHVLAGFDPPTAALGSATPAIEALDVSRTVDFEHISRGAPCGTEAPSVSTERLEAQAETAIADHTPAPEAADTGITACPSIEERTASGSTARAEYEPLVPNAHPAESATATAAAQPPTTTTEVAEAVTIPEPHKADGTTVETAVGEAAEFETLASDGKHEQLSQQDAPAFAAISTGGVAAAACSSPTDAADARMAQGGHAPNPGDVPIKPYPSKPAQHRDRRGQSRTVRSPKQVGTGPEVSTAASASTVHLPAEARLRLMRHPVRRTVSLAAVLARPSGYPERITLRLGGRMVVSAYSDDRYDDVDLDWTPDLLSGETRLDCDEGYQWLRSSRRVHIFSDQPNKLGLVSVGAVSLSAPSTIVCRGDDEEAVRSAAAACGSPELLSHHGWAGVPEGWVVLSNYCPAHAASCTLAPSLSPLDPGFATEIRLSGGLQVRPGSFAQGSPPRIEIEPLPMGARATIDGKPAEMGDDGAWRAAGWDAPGEHLVDVVPGPSRTYRIIGDPWLDKGWDRWNAHPDRFLNPSEGPWARAQICGASLFGPSGEHVLAAQAVAAVIALGLRRGVVVLRPRPDAPVALGLLQEAPAFLVSSWGPRRTHGHVAWLAPVSSSPVSRAIDPQWLAVVRSAGGRRLPLLGTSAAGHDAWRRARERARRYRKPGT
jgi:hypothetical protein